MTTLAEIREHYPESKQPEKIKEVEEEKPKKEKKSK
jgi:hypothetical protein